MDSSYRHLTEAYLENSIMLPEEAPEEARAAERRSESFRLRRALLRLAETYCVAKGIAPDSNEAVEAFDEASNTADSIIFLYVGLPFSMQERSKLPPEQITEKMALSVPGHIQHLVSYARKHGGLGVLQDDLSAAVGVYVRGRFKSPEVDRILLRALTHVEIVAFIGEMTRKNVVTGRSRVDDTAAHSLLGALWRLSKLILLVWLISAAIAIAPRIAPSLPSDIMTLISFGVAGLGTLFLIALGIIGMTSMLGENRNRGAQNESTLKMISDMNGFYLEFRGNGPFSLQHFMRQVNNLSDKGVVWPSGLFVLIDDMVERKVTTF